MWLVFTIRTHIEALHWAAKAKPFLEKGNAKYSSLQRLSREISKYVLGERKIMKLLRTLTFLFVVHRIRSGVSKELSKRINVRLPEEVQLEEIMNNVQKWQTQLKRKSQVRLCHIFLHVCV